VLKLKYKTAANLALKIFETNNKTIYKPVIKSNLNMKYTAYKSRNAMTYDKKETWPNFMALTTIIFVVAAILSTFKCEEYTAKSVLYQEQASGEWTNFHNKSLKKAVAETHRDILVLEIKAIPKWKKDLITAYQNKINEYDHSAKGYDKEKPEIKMKAESFESLRDKERVHSKEFWMALIFLLVSVLISSIAALIKLKYVWVLGIGVGLVGLFYFINGFILLI